jgi:hypothetical protein
MSEPANEDRDAPKPAAPRKGAGPAAEDREARLAAALRANLRRRKVAARGPEPPPDPED